jgi:broad specificity phosphatase PhoE
MSDPLTRLRRRPQLAPLLLPLLALVVAGATVFGLSLWARTTVVILVRHAEAATSDATSDTGDPDLSPAGESRARRLGPFLAELLAGRAVDYLYSADLRRAQQTAASVANQFQVPINLLGASDWSGLAGRIQREHRGATVVVVGAATELAGLARRLGNATIAPDADDHASVFVVTAPSLGPPWLLRVRYGDGPERKPVSDKKSR